MTTSDYAIFGSMILCVGMLWLVYENNVRESKEDFITAHRCMMADPLPANGIEPAYVCNDGRLYNYQAIPSKVFGVIRL
jgi:hypothetical protein